MDIKTTLKTSVAAGALLALAAPMAASQAEAGIKNQNSKIDLTVGGQIVRALAYADDGSNEELFMLDNPSSGTRIRFIVKGQVTESMAIGGLLEYDVGQDGEAARFTTTTGDAEMTDTAAHGVRHHYIDFKHKSLGTFSLGRGNTATNGFMETNHSGSFLNAMGSSGVGAMSFRDDAGTTFVAVSSVSDYLDNGDGGRNNRIRYDSPKFAGFGLAVSVQDDTTPSFAVRYGGKVMGLAVKAVIGYQDHSAGSTTEDDTIGGSIGIKHDSGFSLAGAYGKRDREVGNDNDPKAWRLSAGYEAKLTSLGSTIFDVTYWNIEDDNAVGNDFESIRVSAIQKLAAAGSDVGVMFENNSFDNAANTNFDDINVFWFAAKLNF